MLSYVVAVLCSFFILAARKEGVVNAQNCNLSLQDCVVLVNSPSARAKFPRASYDTYSCTTENAREYEVHVLGVYQPLGGVRRFRQLPSDVGDVQVNIIQAPGSVTKPLKLVLASYEAANWKISVPSGGQIQDIHVFSYYAPQSSVTVLGAATQPNTVLERRYLGYGKRRRDSLFTAVQNKFGFITSFTGSYETNVWNLTVGVNSQCVPGPNGAEDACTVHQNGLYRDPDDCSRYINCQNGSATFKQCLAGSLWNDIIKTCDHPQNANCDVDPDPDMTSLEANQERCLLSSTCWLQTSFLYEDNWNDCHGAQYITKTTYGPYLGVILCTAIRYKLFMSERLGDTFKNIADISGHGQDHCELVGSNEAQANLPSHFWDSPTAYGYTRAQAGEPFRYTKIGFGPSDMSQWTGKYYVRWYECGVQIPGNSRVVVMTGPAATSVGRSTTTTTTTTTTTVDSRSTTTTAPPTPVDPNSLHLTTKPHNISDGLGALVFLVCAASDPDAEIFWYHNDIPLTPTRHPDHVTIYTGQHGSEVTIDGLVEEDAGKYVCDAENDEEIASAAAYIHVELPECNINFINRPTDKSVQARTSRIHIPCSASNARRIDWYKEDTLIRNRPGKYRISPISHHLMIRDICLSDMGKYRCVAHKNDETCRSELHMVLTVWHECGQPVIAQPAQRPPKERSGHIVGGSIATVGSAPWMAQVFETGAGVFCGGTLIARRWILTAAHCISDFQTTYTRPLLIQNLQIKLGKYSRQSVEDQERIYTVERIVSHESFIGSIYDKDIALLQLDTDVEYNDYIKPICLVPADFHRRHFLNGQRLGTVTGWGALSETGPAPTNLQEIQLPLQNRSTCARSTTRRITDNMFCAGFAQQIIGDACKGDSGGPFIMEHGGKWYQVGIVSWGEGCARPGKYGFYTKMANFYSWIMGKIGENCA